MRYAIFAVTKSGLQLARRIRLLLLDDGTDIYGKDHPQRSVEGGSPEALSDTPDAFQTDIRPFHRLRDCVDANFHRYDALIFIMAAGIVVRTIAPHIQDKLRDPAVVIMDEQARNVISLLSGHIGGANLLTQRLAEGLGANAVITTATDVEGLLAPDVVAMRLALRPWPREQIQVLNRSLLENVPVSYYVDRALLHSSFYTEQLTSWGMDAIRISADELPRNGLRVFLTATSPAPCPGLLCLSPRRLVAGVGCRKGINKKFILDAISQACKRIHRSQEDISLIASTVVKKDEAGILEAAAELGAETCFLSHDTMRQTIQRYGLGESDFVKKTIGIGNVCEAAALSCVERGTLALPKTAYHQATVALVWEK